MEISGSDDRSDVYYYCSCCSPVFHKRLRYKCVMTVGLNITEWRATNTLSWLRSFIYKCRMFASLACMYANRPRIDLLISTFGEKMLVFVVLTVHLT